MWNGLRDFRVWPLEQGQTSLSDLVFDEGASKFKSPKIGSLRNPAKWLNFRIIGDTHTDLFFVGEQEAKGATTSVG